MAITSGASPGIVVTTPAKDSRLTETTLGSQSGANANQVIVPNAIGTNNEGNLMSSPTYVGRLIMIRPFADGLSDTSSVSNGGTGYSVSDVLTLSGGTRNNAATITVTGVSGGVVTAFTVTTRGDYTVTPGSPVSTTGGTGTGCTIAAEWLPNQEVNYISADASNTLTCSNDWIQPPISGEDWAICYILADAATLTGLSLINKRVSDYSSSRRFTVGNGTNIAWFALLDGASLETSDNSSTSVADFIVEANARFDNGYLVQGLPVGGGYIIGTPAVNGEWVFDSKSGGQCFLYDWFLTCVKNNQCNFDGDIFLNKGKFFAATDTLEFTGANVNLEAIFVQGRGTSTETIVWTGGVAVFDFIVADIAGFTSETTTGAESFFLVDPVFLRTAPKVTVEQDKTWIIVNPIWTIDESDQSDILFNSGTNNVVWWATLVEFVVTNTALGPIPSAKVYVYEGGITDDLQLDLNTDADGAVFDAYIYKQYDDDGASGLTVVTLSSFALKIFAYGGLPFVVPISQTEPWKTNVAIVVDDHISEAVEATAITNGPTVAPTRDTNSNTLLFFDTGVNTLNVGETVTGGSSGATGVVQEISEGDSVSGKVFLKTRNATAFTQNESLSSSGTWTGGVLNNATFFQNFKIHIDGDNKSMQLIYNWQAAKMAETTLDAIWEVLIEWGTSNFGYLLLWDGAGYVTAMNSSEGVFVSKRGAGDITFFTADDGTTWTPPQTRTHTVNGLDAGSQVVWLTRPGEVELENKAEVSGVATYTYVWSSDVDIWVQILDLNKKNDLLETVLTNGNVTLTAPQKDDPFYLNP